MARSRSRRRAATIPYDKHRFYEAAVQSPEADLDFFQRVYRRHRRRPFRRLREDFCGTALISCTWVRRHRDNEAWGVDLHRPTLDWGRRHHVGRLKPHQQARVHLLEADVLDVREPAVDVVAAMNFSYSVFKTRPELLRYFQAVRRSLAPGGIFFVDAFGGKETMGELEEPKRIPASTTWSGERVPAFTYIWEQARFNPVDHHILCYIHFKLADGTMKRRAFRYDWRLWTLPELQELMREAGFQATEIYVEGWDDEADDTDGIFRRRVRFENQESWVAYVVGLA